MVRELEPRADQGWGQGPAGRTPLSDSPTQDSPQVEPTDKMTCPTSFQTQGTPFTEEAVEMTKWLPKLMCRKWHRPFSSESPDPGFMSLSPNHGRKLLPQAPPPPVPLLQGHSWGGGSQVT